MKPKRIKKLQARSRNLKVMTLDARTMVVESRSDEFNNHIVKVRFGRRGNVHTECTCDWSKYNGMACAHTMAALEHLASRKGRRLSFWLREDEARRQKQRVFYMEGGEPEEGVWITSRAS